MKYIRTKDGIYQFDETNEKDYLNYCSSAIADTIKELVDGYYVDKNKDVFIEDEVYEKGSEEVSQWLKSYLVSCAKKALMYMLSLKPTKGSFMSQK